MRIIPWFVVGAMSLMAGPVNQICFGTSTDRAGDGHCWRASGVTTKVSERCCKFECPSQELRRWSILALMDVTKMVDSLHEELRGLNLAIQALEAIAAGRGKPRGRPPKVESTGIAGVKRRGRPPGSKNKKKPEVSI